MENIQDSVQVLIFYTFEAVVPVFFCFLGFFNTEWPEKMELLKKLGFVKIAFKITF